jgi:hypothetical protein
MFDQQDWDSVSTPVNRPRQPVVPPSGGYGRVVTGGPRLAPPVTPNQDAASAASAAASAAAANRSNATTPGDVQGRDLENRLRALEVDRGGLTAEQQQNLNNARAELEAMSQQMGTLGEQYRRNFQNNDPMIALGLSENEREFDRNAGMLRQQAQGAFRNPNSGTVSDLDARLLEQAYGIGSQQWDVENEAVLDGLQRRLNQRRAAMGLPPTDWRAPTAPGAASPQPGMGTVGNLPPPGPNERGQNAGQNQLDNEGGTYATAEDRQRAERIAGQLTGLARSGKSPEEINAWLRQNGLQPLTPEAVQSVNNYRRAGQPGRFPGFSPNIIPTGRSDPNITTGIANSPLGAAVIGGGDALTFGTLDNMTANPERTRAGMELLREQHPVESFLGEAGASLIPGVGLERAAAYGIRGLNSLRGGQTVARLGDEARTLGEMAVRPLGNAAYGAGYGAGSADQNGGGLLERVQGAGRGALLSAAGGEVGDRFTAGAGRALTGTRNAAVRRLTERGVPLTIGDIAAGGGIVGRSVSRVQNALESVPVLGDAIRARRADSRDGLSRATFDEALAPIGASTNGVVGEEGVGIAREAVRGAYGRALDTVRVRPDTQFATALTNIQRRAAELPEDLQGHYSRWVRTRLAPALKNGNLTGTSFQALRQELREDLNSIAGELGARDLGIVLRRTEAALSGLVRRQSPDTRAALRAADQAFRRTRVNEAAVSSSITNNVQPGIPTPNQLGQAARANANRFGGTAATTSRPFYQLQRDAQNVLPSTLPNSGTVDRSWVLQAFPAALAGGAYQAGLVDKETAALFAGLGLPYTRAGQQTLQKLLVSRPERVRQIGEAIIARRQLGARAGAGGANVLTDQTPSPDGR